MSDEEAFWLMVVIQENYLPPDYYLDGLSGAIIDQKVFDNILNFKFPEVLNHLKSMKLQTGFE